MPLRPVTQMLFNELRRDPCRDRDDERFRLHYVGDSRKHRHHVLRLHAQQQHRRVLRHLPVVTRRSNPRRLRKRLTPLRRHIGCDDLIRPQYSCSNNPTRDRLRHVPRAKNSKFDAHGAIVAGGQARVNGDAVTSAPIYSQECSSNASSSLGAEAPAFLPPSPSKRACPTSTSPSSAQKTSGLSASAKARPASSPLTCMAISASISESSTQKPIPSGSSASASSGAS